VYSVRGLEHRTADLSKQDREPMTKREEFDVLGGVTANPQQYPKGLYVTSCCRGLPNAVTSDEAELKQI
jgi:hypothetical protein